MRVSLILLFACAASGAEPKSLLENGGFELVASVRGVGKMGGKHRSWTLKGSPLAPAHWTLSSYFGGTLSVLSGGAAEGERCLHIEAGEAREAHVFQLCPAIKPGRGYRVSLRYRGGPVLIRAYEYTAKHSAPFIETITTCKICFI